MQLLQLRKDDVPSLNTWMNRVREYKNEMLQILSSSVLQKISSRISGNHYANETRYYISNIEQLVFSIC